MTVINLTPAADGYAQVLRTAGDLNLLSLHLDGARPLARSSRVYFAVSCGEEMTYASEDARTAAQRFDDLRRSRSSAQPEDYLESHPTTLPTIRGESFHKLAAQLSRHLLRDDRL